MKTQLLQDFDESGSAAGDAGAVPSPAARPATDGGGRDAPAPPRPARYAQRPQAPPAPSAAVWHRPQAQAAAQAAAQGSAPVGQSVQRGEPGAMAGAAPAAAGQMRPPGAQTPSQSRATQSRQHAAAGAWTGPRPFPPDRQAAAAGAPAREQAPAQPPAATPPPIGPPPASDLPDWLAERLREDAEQESDRQHKRQMARRALGWSAAATIVAMLAVGGYWFYQESRVEGVLDVVANTSPAAPGPDGAPRAGVPPAAQATPAAASAGTAATIPAPTTPPTSASGVDATAPGPADTAPDAAHAAVHADAAPARAQAAAANAVDDSAADQPLAPARPPAVAKHRKPPTHADAHPRSAAARADSEPSPAQRRWETLMQCRALGYDERECRQRGCMMTHFGLACPG